MATTRETEIKQEISHLELGLKLCETKDEALAARFRARIGELKRELRSLDDTPVLFRPTPRPPAPPQENATGDSGVFRRPGRAR